MSTDLKSQPFTKYKNNLKNSFSKDIAKICKHLACKFCSGTLCRRKRDNNGFSVAAFPEDLKFGHFAFSRRVIVMFVFFCCTVDCIMVNNYRNLDCMY